MAHYSTFVNIMGTKIMYQHIAKYFCSMNTFKYQFPDLSQNADYSAKDYNQHLISVVKSKSKIRTGTQVTLNHNYTNFNN